MQNNNYSLHSTLLVLELYILYIICVKKLILINFYEYYCQKTFLNKRF